MLRLLGDLRELLDHAGALHLHGRVEIFQSPYDAAVKVGGRVGQMFRRAVAGGRDLRGDCVGALLERLRHHGASGGERLADLDADLSHAFGGLARLDGHGVDDQVAGGGDLGARLLGAGGDDGRHAVGGFGDAGIDALGDLLDVEREGLVRVGDGFTEPPGVGKNRVAFALQLLDEVPHTPFVVVIGALQRRDLVLDHGLEFGGARDGALDAVAERGDLAADRLADGDDRVGGKVLGLGEADGNLGHRAGDGAQFLHAADQHGEQQEAGGRKQKPGGDREDDRIGQELAEREFLAVERDGPGDAADDPER